MPKIRLLDRLLSRVVRKGVLEVTHSDGTVVRHGTETEGFPNVFIRFTSDAAERRILRNPSLGAAETFMDGQLIIANEDVMGLAELFRANGPWDHGREPDDGTALKKVGEKLVTAIDGINRATRAKKNIAHHYDIGNALYQLFLDKDHMQYSCAYWPSLDITLEQAQEAKLAHIAAKLDLAPGQRILDIGCGWGGMAIYLAKHADVRVHGITLSEEQLALARVRAQEAGVADRITFELVDYRALSGRGEIYDRIVSVGMFEHVGQAQFDTYFREVAKLLTPEGVALIHTIGRFGGPGSTDAFTRKYIFPGGYIPALSETLAASERSRLIATDVENLRLHYAFTLREWYKRCQDNKAAIVALYDERFYRMWTFYLAGATAAFESGGMCNYQIQYSRNRRTLPLTRGYMAEAEAALLASN
ncbi:SAM-dependent methyltransferase [Novosphingobium sp. 9]|uniref:SAM-dependent methyltransferase n=1 Tax=Novosphingobium sp. 9 TaxID=2025349 RepID=UPI0021B5B011|nr:cyclopropane-fatty-acyl-phospholipid synthase family protein [Novosphingobium sp. 9]